MAGASGCLTAAGLIKAAADVESKKLPAGAAAAEPDCHCSTLSERVVQRLLINSQRFCCLSDHCNAGVTSLVISGEVLSPVM